MEFWRNVLKQVLLTHSEFDELWDQGRGKALNAAVMAKNKARQSHTNLEMNTTPAYSLLGSTVLWGPWPIELQKPTLLYLITAFSALSFNLTFVHQRYFSTYSNYLSLGLPNLILPSGLLSNIFLTTVTTCNIHSNLFFAIYPTISKWYRDLTWIKRIYTGCRRRNVPDFERVFLMLKYTDITQNTYVQSLTVTEIMAREVWNFDSCYTIIDYQIHIKTGRNMWFL